MEGVHDIVFVRDSCFLIDFAPLLIPLVQTDRSEAYPVIVLKLRHVTGALDGFSQVVHVQLDSFIVGQIHGRFDHVKLIILKALVYVSRTALEQSKLFGVVEGGNGGHPHVLIGVGIKPLKKFG